MALQRRLRAPRPPLPTLGHFTAWSLGTGKMEVRGWEAAGAGGGKPALPEGPGHSAAAEPLGQDASRAGSDAASAGEPSGQWDVRISGEKRKTKRNPDTCDMAVPARRQALEESGP